VLVSIPTLRISDWDSFHSVFAEVFGFPDFYGRNMDF
jgi:RNAse (barnase) inhibitor barstar